MSGTAEEKQRVRILQLSFARELGHGICVSRLAHRVAKELRLPETTCYDLAVAGLLHDIGKLEVRKYLYGREEETLTIEELKYVRMHAELGARILREEGYPAHIAEWVYCHHENCDGSGYPRNLMKKSIPLEARIIRICDVFAALISDRSYRKAFDVDTAVDLMIEEAKYYDLRIFMAFLNVIHSEWLESILNIRETEQELNRFL